MPKLQEAKTPKYLQLFEHWRDLILEGALEPGKQLPSFSEMRAQHGVTVTTVERVYSMLAQEGLIVREHRRGVYVAERPANEAVKTGTIGFLYGGPPELRRRPYWSLLIEGIQEEAERHNAQILLINSVGSAKWAKVDGVIVHETWENVQGDLVCETWNGGAPRWLPPGMPCTAVLSPIDDVVSVVADDYKAARDMTRYLLSRGHRRIAYLSSVVDPLSRRRTEGYQEALRTSGIEFEPDWIRPIYDFSDATVHYLGGGYNSMKRWLEEGWAGLGCTALLTQNDDTAMGAIQALREAGIGVPHEVSVVGFDGTGVDQFFAPRLTTVEVPLKQIGITAVKLLMQQMSGDENMPTTITLPAQIREGASVCTIHSP